MTSVPTVEVVQIERDVPCRIWTIALRITWNGEIGHYEFPLSPSAWRFAKDNLNSMGDGDHGPCLSVEPITTEAKR